MTRVDGLDDLWLARPEQDVAAAACSNLRQGGPPGTTADHSKPVEAHAFTPAPRTFSASGSSGQRARAGASSWIGEPARKPFRARPGDHRRIVGAQPSRRNAELAALIGSELLKRRADRAIGGDSAGDDQSWGIASLRAPAASGRRGNRRPPAGRTRQYRPVCNCRRLPLLHRALQPGEGEMRLARTHQGPRQRHGARIACRPPVPRSPARRDKAGRAAWPSCRTPPPRHRRSSSRAGGTRRPTRTSSNWQCPPDTSSSR